MDKCCPICCCDPKDCSCNEIREDHKQRSGKIDFGMDDNYQIPRSRTQLIPLSRTDDFGFPIEKNKFNPKVILRKKPKKVV